MAAVLKLIVAVALGLTLLPWSATGLASQLDARGWWPPHDPWSVLIGVGLAVPLVLWQRPNWFIHTFVHELCHLFVSILVLFRLPRDFRASAGQGGFVMHVKTDPVRTTLIAIAPYALPLLLVPVLIARMIVTAPGTWRSVLSGAVAFLVVHHLHALYYNIRLNLWSKEADLVRVGRPLSFVLIATAAIWVGRWVHAVLF